MPKTLQQIVTDLASDFVTRRRPTHQILTDAKRYAEAILRDESLAVADTLLDSPHPELRVAGRLIESFEKALTNETLNEYLRGTSVLVNQECACADPSVVDRTCPRYGAPDHGQIVAKRWADKILSAKQS